MGLSFSSWASRIPTVKHDLHLNDSEIGIALFAVPFGQLLMMFFARKLVVHFGSVRVVPFVTLMYALVLITIGLAQNIVQLSIILVFFGVLANLANISINTQGVYAERVFRRAIMASFHGMWSLAGFAGALLGMALLALQLSTFMHFVIVAFLVLILVLIGSKNLIVDKNESVITAEDKPFKKPDASLIMLGIVGFCCLFCEGLMYDWSGIYFKDVVKASGATAVIGYSSFMVMMALGRFLGDGLITKIGRKKLLQINGLMIATGLLLAVFLPNIITCTLAFMIVGLGVSTVMPTLFSMAGKHKFIPPAKALTTVYSISFVGFFMGPAIGSIAKNFGLKMSFGLIALFGFFIFFLVKKVKVPK